MTTLVRTESAVRRLMVLGSKEQPFRLGRQSVLFCSEHTSALADAIAAELGVPKGMIVRGRDAGEQTYRFVVPDRLYLLDKDVVYVSCIRNDDDLFELIRVGYSLASNGARRRIFLLPYLAYSDKVRSSVPGEVSTAKIHASLLASIPSTGEGNVFVFCELPVQGFVHYFESDCRRMELRVTNLVQSAVLSLHAQSLVFAGVSLDSVRLLSDVIGNVKDRDVVLVVDVFRRSEAIVRAAQLYRRAQARTVCAVIAHLAFDPDEGDALQELSDAPIDRVIVTNTHSNAHGAETLPKFIVVDVAPVFVSAIRTVVQSGL